MGISLPLTGLTPARRQAHAGLLLVQLRALQVGLGGGGLLVGGDLGGVLQRAPLQPLAHQLVLGESTI